MKRLIMLILLVAIIGCSPPEGEYGSISRNVEYYRGIMHSGANLGFAYSQAGKTKKQLAKEVDKIINEIIEEN